MPEEVKEENLQEAENILGKRRRKISR